MSALPRARPRLSKFPERAFEFAIHRVRSGAGPRWRMICKLITVWRDEPDNPIAIRAIPNLRGENECRRSFVTSAVGQYLCRHFPLMAGGKYRDRRQCETFCKYLSTSYIQPSSIIRPQGFSANSASFLDNPD